MTDKKTMAAIFNDFMALYLGKEQVGIKPLLKKYDNHPMLLGLLSNMDMAVKLPVPKVIQEVYQVYKKFRDQELEDKDWEEIMDTTRSISEEWKDKDGKDNKWCDRIIVDLVCILDADEKERRDVAKEVEKEMEEAMREGDHAA